jgi:hypothetical protein
MTMTELLPSLQNLSRLEKLKVIQFLIGELEKEEADLSLNSHQTYEIWSPYDSFSAANTLEKLLQEGIDE